MENILGSDGEHDPLRIGAVLKYLSPDIAALQEVEAKDTDDCQVLEFLARQNGLTPIEGPTIIAEQGHFGNMLLTRLDVLSVQHIDLSVPGRERRGAIVAELSAHNRRLRVIATHLGLNPTERRHQIKKLLAAMRNSEREVPVTVLAGDINEWFLWGRPLRWLRRYFGQSLYIRTYPARFPFLALDRLWCSPADRLAGLFAYKSRITRIASDHLPLVGELTL